MYKYKELKTGKIILKDEPIKGVEKFNYQLLEWRRNTKMNSNKILQKTAVKKVAKKVTKKSKK